MSRTTTDRQFLGRADVNDVESILADDETDFGERTYPTPARGDAIFTWDYEPSRRGLGKLYEKAKTSQWNGSTDLDWSTPVDPEKVALEMAPAAAAIQQRMADIAGSPVKGWGKREWTTFQVEALNWRMSQFLHGEQGALVCTAKIVETTPWIDAKYYAASQVMDEARHVAFGVLSLQEYYAGLGAEELRERQEFAFEAATRMRDRLMMHAVWERMGVDRKTVTEFLLGIRQMANNPFQAALFSKIVPNCKKLGLLDAGDGWLRERFTEIGVIQYENATDTSQEYEAFDEVARDRSAAAS
ncbi:MAG: ferritin-like domain-containing protein [Acidimicrobiia bacterium]